MRSFISAYKVLVRVLQNCSRFMAPLDDIVAGRQSNEAISWSDDLTAAFKEAQLALSSNHTITLPNPDDLLWIVTDGAVRPPGIGATLYVTRGNKFHLTGFFSAKLRGSQFSWLPCEIEALSIATATKHFSPYIIQSNNNACILTDSMHTLCPSVRKLFRGQFSTSPHVSSFLSVLSRFQASVRHVSGTAILLFDFASHEVPCQDVTGQVCAFIHRTQESVVRQTSIQNILHGHARLPFTTRASWLAIQSETKDLRRTHAHLVKGTRPSKKLTSVKDIKRYLNVATIAKNGLLVVKRDEPFTCSRECIIVPRQVLDGLLTALHIQLSHP